MPLYYQQNINEFAKMAVWKIEEPIGFFTEQLPINPSITHPAQQLQHLAGRYLLKLLYPDFPLQLIQIAESRKPFLPNHPYYFSISHCDGYAAAIVSKGYGVGIDIEQITKRIDKVKHKFLHPVELTDWDIAALQDEDRIATLTLLWSCKEAIFKWWGRGDIDFSKSMRISANVLGQEGMLEARFLKEGFATKLDLNYQLKNGLSLVWVLKETEPLEY